MIYLDHNATTPPHEDVIAALTDCMRQTWANASSTHGPGQDAKRALGAARQQVARCFVAKPNEVIFTSGATEANHLAVHGAIARSGRRHLLTSAVEHAGFHKMLRLLPDAAVDWIPVHADGRLNLRAAEGLMRKDLALLSVMAANNETGVLMPVAELAALAHAHDTLLHVDATQWAGKLPLSLADCGADLITLSAHKLGGPKGVGALLVRSPLAWPAWMAGSQERGRRGGTENLPGIVGFGAACAALERGEPLPQRAARVSRLRDQFEAGLLQALPSTVVWGRGVPRLPNTLCLRFGELPADLVLQRMETLGIVAASGAACASGGSDPSHVLSAMGVGREEALCAVRLSLGADTSEAEVREVLKRLPPVLAPLMQEATLPA